MPVKRPRLTQEWPRRGAPARVVAETANESPGASWVAFRALSPVEQRPRGGLPAYMQKMCGRVIQASPPDQLGLKIIDALAPRDNHQISYRTAWLKANYPAEYMAALISSVMDTKEIS